MAARCSLPRGWHVRRLPSADRAAPTTPTARWPRSARSPARARSLQRVAGRARPRRSVRIGVGVNSGRILSGHVGCEVRVEYTAIGDPVNTAFRLEELTKELPHTADLEHDSGHAARPGARSALHRLH